ncbi:unnamed protein product [Allacma fusca]|uniref:Phospholipase A-2-activating protein n=1 Tax=Allacma fusca TaxID=39272 RepID=A0A8J2LN23_9HEXA|nr:unnamed protein product [Allacma fusca]
MTESYKLRCTLLGHSMDVRGVATGDTEGGKHFIVSSSRDRTSKVWMPTDLGTLEVFQSCEGHTNFVSCVHVLQPNVKYPHGLILTGSHDHTVLGFEIGKPVPVFRLLGHKGPVCSISSTEDSILITGSWDESAKLWENQNCIASLEGHGAAVWAVASLPGVNKNFLTGSADKEIRFWNGSQMVKTYTGHTDCVRTLAIIDSDKFLSGSNDATIRLWSISEGECLSVLYGHTNFIYSIALLPNDQDFVSCGEDRTVRIWKGHECKQAIHLPATSLWSVSVMKNNDVVVGSSDGTVRVFTADPERMASGEELQKFEEEVAATSIAAQQDLGGLKVSQLPGPEALLVEGKKDGDTKMIREGSRVSCYSWSSGDRKWNKVGDVVGASGATQNTSGKVLHDGKEYDYVFSVDLDGTATLKLPYNISEDPWFAAKRFIDKNDLNPQFLDQVANFIIQNTKGMVLGSGSDSNYADPFTGGNRYVPGSVESARAGGFDGLDPFTGAGAYRSGASTVATAKKVTELSVPPCFPCANFLQFPQPPSTEGLKSKLLTFAQDLGINIEENTINYLISNIIEGHYTEELHALVMNILAWPKEKVFPVLDLLRVGVLNDQFSVRLNEQLSIYEGLFSKFVSQAYPVNQMLILRLLNNLFGKQTALLMTHRGAIVSEVLNNLSKAKNNQIAAGTLLLNYSIVVTSKENPAWSSIENNTEILMAAISVVDVFDDNEAIYRLLVALGNLLVDNTVAAQLFKSLNGDNIVRNYHQNSGLPKIQKCSEQLLTLLV